MVLIHLLSAKVHLRNYLLTTSLKKPFRFLLIPIDLAFYWVKRALKGYCIVHYRPKHFFHQKESFLLYPMSCIVDKPKDFYKP